MKRLISILILFFALCSAKHVSAQGQPTALPQVFGAKFYQFKGYLQIDSGFILSTRNTSWTPKGPTIVYYNRYAWLYDTTAAAWHKLAKSIDVLAYSDTATMLANYLRNVGYGISRSGQTVLWDSATAYSTGLRRKDSLSATNLLGYVTRKILADTAAAIRAAAGGSNTPVNGYAALLRHYDGTGNFWAQNVYPINTLFKKCLYEFWVAPYDSAEYIISTGYGGSHLVLFGFTGGTTGKMLLTGNMWYNGSNIVGLQSQDTIRTGTVHNIAVAYDGTWITTFIDGVPSKRTAYTGYRSIISSPADVDLFIGGSDHSKFAGLFFKGRGFETFDSDIPIGTTSCYFPKTGWQTGNNPYFQVDATTPNRTLVNQSDIPFFGGNVSLVSQAGANYNEFAAGGASPSDTATLPHFVPAILYQSAYSGTASGSYGAGLKAGDEFHRQDQVPAWTNNPALGNTEAGSLGTLTWAMNTTNTSGGSLFAGILSNTAYFNSTNWAYIVSDSPDDSIIVTKATANSEKAINVFARRIDANNYLWVNTDPSSGYTYLWQRIAGSDTYLGDFVTGASFSTIRLVVTGTTARVYENTTLKITATVTGTTGNGVGVGANNAFVRISKFEVY